MKLYIFFQISIIVIIKLLTLNAFNSSSLSVTKLGPCSAKLDDGSIIDLSSLDNPKKPRSFQQSINTYRFNPCSSLKCGGGQGATCQTVSNKYNIVIGEQDRVDVLLVTGGLMFVYSTKSSTKISNLKCICGSYESFTFINESPKDNFNFEFQSPCCCGGGCKHVVIGIKGLSTGSILVILFFSIITFYMLAGILTNKFVRNKNGIEVIPNVTFWTLIGEYIKTGFSFAINQIRGGNRGNAYSSI